MRGLLLSPLLLLCLLLFLAGSATAATRVFAPVYLPAEEAVAAVRLLLKEGERAEVVGNRLVLVASEATLSAVAELLEQLDQRPQQLLIRLSQQSSDLLSGISAGTGKPGVSAGAASTAHGSRRLGNAVQRVEQSLRLMVGEGGWLEVGREIPYTASWAALTGKRVQGFARQIAYRKLSIGFWVIPRQLEAGQVLLDLMPQFSDLVGPSDPPASLQPPEIRFQHLATRLRVPLGTWYPLAESLADRDEVSSAIISWRAGSGKSDRKLMIRIERGE